MKSIIILVLLKSLIYSQTIYDIPFASEGNQIELEIYSDSELKLADVTVKVIEKPDWIKFDSEEKVEAVTDIYNKLGIKALSENKMNGYFDSGLKILDSININHEKKVPLKELVLKLIDREK